MLVIFTPPRFLTRMEIRFIHLEAMVWMMGNLIVLLESVWHHTGGSWQRIDTIIEFKFSIKREISFEGSEQKAQVAFPFAAFNSLRLFLGLVRLLCRSQDSQRLATSLWCHPFQYRSFILVTVELTGIDDVIGTGGSPYLCRGGLNCPAPVEFFKARRGCCKFLTC